jgi:hypothetical protein
MSIPFALIEPYEFIILDAEEDPAFRRRVIKLELKWPRYKTMQNPLTIFAQRPTEVLTPISSKEHKSSRR